MNRLPSHPPDDRPGGARSARDQASAVEETVQAIKHWERALLLARSKAEQVADWIAATAGSGPVLVFHVLWFGVWGPGGMQPALVTRTAGDINKALASADLKEQFAKASTETMVMTTPEFAQFVRKEIEENGKVIKAAGIQPQ